MGDIQSEVVQAMTDKIGIYLENLETLQKGDLYLPHPSFYGPAQDHYQKSLLQSLPADLFFFLTVFLCQTFSILDDEQPVVAARRPIKR